MFWLSLICCFGGTVVLAAGVEGIMNWIEQRPIREEIETPFYITRTYKEIKNGYKY